MRDFMSNTRFALLWSFGSIVALFGAIIAAFMIITVGSWIAASLWGGNASNISPIAALVFLSVLFSTLGMVIGLIFGGIQKAILRMRTNEPWRGWMIASALGGIVGVDVVTVLLFTQGSGYLLWGVMPPTDTLFWFGFQAAVVFFGSLGLCQMFALWQYVHGAWVWILANMVAGVVLFSLLAFGAMSWAATPFFAMMMVFFIAAAPGIVTAFAMVWLISSNWRQNY